MRIAKYAVSCLALAFTVLCNPGIPTAQQLPTPTCAWQFEFTPFGLGNWLFADTGNRWFLMPIDPQWQTTTIAGVYPGSRFFSFAVYDNAPTPTGLADHLYDAHIAPDPGSVNPFVPPDPGTALTDRPQTYTITVTRNKANSAGNALRLNAKTGWLLYRLYLPNAGQVSTGGVPLPSIAINGNTKPLPTCPFVNPQSTLTAMQPQFVPSTLEAPLPPVPPVPDRIWFGPILAPPPQLLPNPDNKYMTSFFMPAYEPGRILVIRGKMPAFPDTYHGGPVWRPAPGFGTVQMRYWSMCLADQVSPLPIDGCAVDASTPLDESGFYTIVISDDVLRPDWLPGRTVWIPWGDETMVPKLIFIRNLLPSPNFSQSVQNALDHGCGVDFKFPTPPDQASIKTAGQCAQKVMGDYYPVAVWCDQSDFRWGGWRACFYPSGNRRK